MLGKRPRPPIKRTTSMTGITTVDPPNVDVPAGQELSSDHDYYTQNNHQMIIGADPHATVGPEEEGSLEYYRNNNMMNGFGESGNSNGLLYDHRFLATMVSPRNHWSNSADFLGTAYFLRTCGLCNRRLAHGKDIYMYRGDTAFCSLECREEQMKHDERKEKFKVMASKKEDHHAASSPSTRSSKASSKSETVAAA